MNKLATRCKCLITNKREMLTEQERTDLKELLKRPWFKVLEKIAEEFEMDILRQLKNINTSNTKDLEILSKNMLFLKWAEAFMETIKAWQNQFANRKED